MREISTIPGRQDRVELDIFDVLLKKKRLVGKKKRIVGKISTIVEKKLSIFLSGMFGKEKRTGRMIVPVVGKKKSSSGIVQERSGRGCKLFCVNGH